MKSTDEIDSLMKEMIDKMGADIQKICNLVDKDNQEQVENFRYGLFILATASIASVIINTDNEHIDLVCSRLFSESKSMLKRFTETDD